VWAKVFGKRFLPLLNRVGDGACSAAVSYVCFWIRHSEVVEVRDV
jgi:hypothetical protein